MIINIHSMIICVVFFEQHFNILHFIRLNVVGPFMIDVTINMKRCFWLVIIYSWPHFKQFEESTIRK